MNRHALLILTAAALVAPLSALAAGRPTPGSTAPSAPATSLPSHSLPAQPDCATSLDGLVAKLKVPGNSSQTGAQSTLLVGSTALAESCGASSGFCVTDGKVTYSGAELVGTSKIGVPTQTERVELPFRILNSGGKAKLKWSYAGKHHTGTVDSCVGGIWTATSGTSAVAIHINDVQTVPH